MVPDPDEANAPDTYCSIQVPYFLSATRRELDAFGHYSTGDGDAGDDVLAIDIRITFTVKVFFELVSDYGVFSFP